MQINNRASFLDVKHVLTKEIGACDFLFYDILSVHAKRKCRRSDKMS